MFIAAHFASLSNVISMRWLWTLDSYPNLFVECAQRLQISCTATTPTRCVISSSNIRIASCSALDNSAADAGELLENAAGLRAVPGPCPSSTAATSSISKIDHLGLIEPFGTYREWIRLTGIKLPPDVLEKFYHANGSD